MKPLAASLIVTALLFSCTGQNPDGQQVVLRVLSGAVPDNAQVFIAGNHGELGMWQPDAVPLALIENGVWELRKSFPAGTHLQYKLTLGSWDHEALDAEGNVPANNTLNVLSDTLVQHTIGAWGGRSGSRPSHITGQARYHQGMQWQGLRDHDVIVWLPPGYQASRTKRYPVLYMHDGQNVFDPATSYTGFDWRVDEVADSLIRAGKVQPFLVVAISNTADRSAEYSDSELGSRYRDFLIHGVKTMVDSVYRTLPGREHTAVMGSSMGGLASFLLLWKHPDVFSRAGCLSPAFVRQYSSIVDSVRASDRQPLPETRLYMDNGGVDLDAVLQPGCDAMMAALKQKGYVMGENLSWFVDPAAEHNEAAWAARVWRPLQYFFGVE